jgi:hypothetical protein
MVSGYTALAVKHCAKYCKLRLVGSRKLYTISQDEYGVEWVEMSGLELEGDSDQPFKISVFGESATRFVSVCFVSASA